MREFHRPRGLPTTEVSSLNVADCIAENAKFAATLKAKNIKLFVSIVKAMSFVQNTEIQLSDAGLKYVAEESKSFQAAAYFKKDFFSFFYLAPEIIDDVAAFGVNLTRFTDLLSAFLDNDLSNMNIVYYSDQNTILFEIKQKDSIDATNNRTKQQTVNEEDTAGEIVTEYFLKTMETVNPISFTVLDPSIRSSLMLNAYDFYGIINDFDRSMDKIEIKITPKKVTFRSLGISQYETLTKIQSNNEVFDKYESFEPTQYVYKFTYFRVMQKALTLSSKISMLTHADGMLQVQLMVKSEDSQDSSAFIEYNMIPDIIDDEDDDE